MEVEKVNVFTQKKVSERLKNFLITVWNLPNQPLVLFLYK